MTELILRHKCHTKRCGGHTFKYIAEKGICFCVLCGKENEEALKKARRKFK